MKAEVEISFRFTNDDDEIYRSGAETLQVPLYCYVEAYMILEKALVEVEELARRQEAAAKSN